jgi:hypothetical protein
VQPRFNDSRWAVGTGPFHFDRIFRDELNAFLLQSKSAATVPSQATLYFRYAFDLSRQQVGAGSQFRLEIQTMDPNVALWVNGKPLPKESAKKTTHEYWIPPKPPAPKKEAKAKPATVAEPQAIVPSGPPAQVADFLWAGRNVVAARVTANPESTHTLLFQLRLDEVRKPTGVDGEEVVQKQVTDRAVVCDLCSNLPGRVPSCVNACPHDAAMRVDARFSFPVK